MYSIEEAGDMPWHPGTGAFLVFVSKLTTLKSEKQHLF
jgi:hypothetical protein